MATTKRGREAAKVDDDADRKVLPLPVDLPLESVLALPTDNHRLEALAREPETQALQGSIATVGLLQPIGVRPAVKEGLYVVCWGFRRLAALQGLKAKTVRAVVLPDDVVGTDVATMRAVENTSRLDLNPIEQCLAVCEVVDNCAAAIRDELAKGAGGGEGEGVNLVEVERRAFVEAARRLGRTESWVRDRAYLRRLSKRVTALVVDGRLPLPHAREIAKLADHDRQWEVAQGCALDSQGLGGVPLSTVQSRVERFTAILEGVPWNLAVPFAGALACSVCPKNSANITGLFEVKGEVAKAAYCTDRACYSSKRTAAQGAIKRATEKVVALVVKATPKKDQAKEREDAKAAGLNYVEPPPPPKLTAEGLAEFAPAQVDPRALASRVKDELAARKGGKTVGRPQVAKQVEDPKRVARREAEQERNDLLQKRTAAALGKIEKHFRAKPLVVVALSLLEDCAAWQKLSNGSDAMCAKAAKSPAVRKLFAAAMKGDVRAIAGHAAPQNVNMLRSSWNMKNHPALEWLAKAAGVELAEVPTVEELVAKRLGKVAKNAEE